MVTRQGARATERQRVRRDTVPTATAEWKQTRDKGGVRGWEVPAPTAQGLPQFVSLTRWGQAAAAGSLRTFRLHEGPGQAERSSLVQGRDLCVHRCKLIVTLTIQPSPESLVSENLLLRQICFQVYFQKSGL